MTKVEVKRNKRLPFTCVDNRIFKDKRKKARHISIYADLCFHADSKGECFPSYKTIAEEAGVGRRTAIETMKDLEKWQYIKKVRRKRDGTNSQTSNLYLIQSEVVQEMHQGGAGAAHE